nr:uncharacterized mitochondrial protein AtMg00810-like [Tanacetum cinerariifolium]
MNKSDLNDVHMNDSQVIGNSLIDSHESDGEANQVNDMFKKSEGYHAVPPPYIGNYMPPRADLSFFGLDDSVFNFTISETITSVNETETSTSKTSKESLEKPKTVRPSAPIIEEWESDSEDENVVEKIEVKKTIKPSLETIEFVNARNTTVENESKAGKPVRKPVKTLIEATRTMLADLLLPIPFWAEAVNTGCYVQNRVLVTKPQNKTPYKLLLSRTPSIGFMRPFGCPVTIINTLDPLGKFDGKVDEGFLVGYSVSSKAFRVFDSRTRIVQKTLHINFMENKPNVTSSGPTWLVDTDTLIEMMNYQPVTAGNQSNHSAGVQEQFDTKKVGEESVQQYVLFLVRYSGSTNPLNTDDDAAFGGKKLEFERRKPESEVHVSLSSSVKTKKHDDKTKKVAKDKSPVESLTRYRNLSAEFEDFSDNNINEVNTANSLIPAVGQISTNNTNTFSIEGPLNAAVSLTHGKSSYVNTSQYPDDLNMLELEDITYSDDEEDVGAKADFANLETTITVSPILTTRIYKDHSVTQIIGDLSSATQTRSMTSTFLYETIEEEVYVCQPPRFEDPDYPDKVYKVVKALYRLHQAPRAWYETLANYLLENGFQRGKIDPTLFIKRKKGELTFFLGLQVKHNPDGIFISQDKYVAEILRKFRLTDRKSASTPIDTEKPLLKDPDGKNVDVHTYRSMIGSLMYLTSSRPDIMFAVCACARFQVTLKVSHLHAVKRIFRYLKGKTHLGLWYPKDSPFNLVAYSDSDYAGASLDRKSKTGGCWFLGCRMISWQCKKQIVDATSFTKAEYVAAASCCAQMLWIQNQLLDYSFGLTMQVALSSMKSLKRMLYAIVKRIKLTFSGVLDDQVQLLPKQTPPETDKTLCTRLLLDLLSH